MTPEQAQMVRLTFVALIDRKAETGRLFYERLFAIAPETSPLFHGDMDAQARKLMDSMAIAIACLRDMPALLNMLGSMAKRHVDYGVREEHYTKVGEALLWTLEKALGDAFTPEVKAAWTSLYGTVAGIMCKAAYGAGAAPAAAAGGR